MKSTNKWIYQHLGGAKIPLFSSVFKVTACCSRISSFCSFHSFPARAERAIPRRTSRKGLARCFNKILFRHSKIQQLQITATTWGSKAAQTMIGSLGTAEQLKAVQLWESRCSSHMAISMQRLNLSTTNSKSRSPAVNRIEHSSDISFMAVLTSHKKWAVSFPLILKLERRKNAAESDINHSNSQRVTSNSVYLWSEKPINFRLNFTRMKCSSVSISSSLTSYFCNQLATFGST